MIGNVGFSHSKSEPSWQFAFAHQYRKHREYNKRQCKTPRPQLRNCGQRSSRWRFDCESNIDAMLKRSRPPGDNLRVVRALTKRIAQLFEKVKLIDQNQ